MQKYTINVSSISSLQEIEIKNTQCLQVTEGRKDTCGGGQKDDGYVPLAPGRPVLEALPTNGFSTSTLLLNLNTNTSRGEMGFCVFCIHTGLEHSGSLDGLEQGPNKKLRESLFVFYCLKLFIKGFYFQNLCEKIRPIVLHWRQCYPQGTSGNI